MVLYITLKRECLQHRKCAISSVDRVPGYEPVGRRFESCMARHLFLFRTGIYRGIAQLVEYRSPKPWVAGSSPPAPAKKKDDCESNRLFSVKSVLADGINPTNVG